MEYDVVVAGGGPGGSSVAYYLARQGVRVLVMDKCTFPREKICGDGVAPRAVRNLYRMGLQERLDGNFNKFHGFRFAGAGKSVVQTLIPATPRFPDYGYIIKRFDLDKILIDYARENGAEVWEDCRVKEPLVEGGRVVGVRALRGSEEIEVTAPVVVGADGPHSVLGRKMGLLVNDPHFLGISMRQYFEGVEDIGDYLEVYPEHAISPGSGWVFPLNREGLANVGVGAMLFHIQRNEIDLHKFFETLIHDTPHVAPKLKNAKPVSPLRGALLRVGLGGSKVECPGMLLIGDAASMTNPVSGEGITYALETGEMAARHILDSRMNGRGFHIDPDEDSFRAKLVDRYQHYFNHGLMSIKWGNRTSLMRPLLAVVSKNQKFRVYMVRSLMYLKH
jgi:geranylgeranyl reductase family protein